MEKTTFKSAAENGAEKQQGSNLRRNLVPHPDCLELIYTDSSNGQYVGTITVRGITPNALRAMLEDANLFIIEESRKMQFAANQAPPKGKQQ